jgi:hypothetical protein
MPYIMSADSPAPDSDTPAATLPALRGLAGLAGLRAVLELFTSAANASTKAFMRHLQEAYAEILSAVSEVRHARLFRHPPIKTFSRRQRF